MRATPGEPPRTTAVGADDHPAHAVEVDVVVARTGSDLDEGLTSTEAARRLDLASFA